MMAVAVLVALSAIYLTTFVSADCDTLLMRCFTNTWQTCSSFEAVGSITPEDCDHAHQLCIVTEIENARSQAQSNSTASDVERYTNSFEHSTGCGSELKQCLETGDPEWDPVDYGLHVRDCRRSFEQCIRAEIESAQSLVESSQSTLGAERSASRSEATMAECIDQLAGCLVITYTKCSELNLACPTAEADCYYRHGLCKAGENESDESKVELTRSEAEFMRIAYNNRAPRGCGSSRMRCIWTMLIFHDVLQLPCSVSLADCDSRPSGCRAGRIEIARSQPESSSSAFGYERNTNSPASPTVARSL